MKNPFRAVMVRAAMAISEMLGTVSGYFGRLAVDRMPIGAESWPASPTGGQVSDAKDIRELSEMRHDMLSGIIEIGETVAREVMVPRTEMICLEAAMTYQEVMAVVLDSEHSRIPVYEDRIDNIIGILYTKDLLKFWSETPVEFNLKKLVRSAYFIPETKSLAILLREFQRHRVHIAIVVDEYGGVGGLVTLEDILEQITGEIQDEYDVADAQVTKLDGGDYLLDARMEIEAVEELLGIEIEKDEFESLGGLAIAVLGHLPRQGESFSYKGHRFTVDKATERKVVRIRVGVISEPIDEDSGQKG